MAYFQRLYESTDESNGKLLSVLAMEFERERSSSNQYITAWDVKQ